MSWTNQVIPNPNPNANPTPALIFLPRTTHTHAHSSGKGWWGGTKIPEQTAFMTEIQKEDFSSNLEYMQYLEQEVSRLKR